MQRSRLSVVCYSSKSSSQDCNAVCLFFFFMPPPIISSALALGCRTAAASPFWLMLLQCWMKMESVCAAWGPLLRRHLLPRGVWSNHSWHIEKKKPHALQRKHKVNWRIMFALNFLTLSFHRCLFLSSTLLFPLLSSFRDLFCLVNGFLTTFTSLAERNPEEQTHWSLSVKIFSVAWCGFAKHNIRCCSRLPSWSAAITPMNISPLQNVGRSEEARPCGERHKYLPLSGF